MFYLNINLFLLVIQTLIHTIGAFIMCFIIIEIT